MDLGAFSVSLAVADIAASREFYEKLGFSVVLGDPSQGWQIVRNGTTTIGLFHGMFERNVLTFNPGWDSDAKPVEEFSEIRDIQRELKAAGVSFEQEAPEDTTGPASFIIADPDGNPIFFDQHV
jgi:catechol 2,3-dioxygenase-like lactoylglutathione lyase family enzyme